MRLYLLFILLCTSIGSSYGQGPEDNLYVYGEQTGVNTSNSAVLGKNSNGSILFWPYQGQIQVLGGNYVKPYPIPSSIKIQTANFVRTSTNREWVITGSHAYHLENNIIVDAVDVGGEIVQSTVKDGPSYTVWFTYRSGAHIRLAYFKDKKLVRMADCPFTITNYHSLISLKDGRVFLGSVSQYCWITENGYGPVVQTRIPENKYLVMGALNQMNTILVRSIDPPVQVARFDGMNLRFILTNRKLTEVSHFSGDLAVLNHKDGRKEIIQFTDSTERTVGLFRYPDAIRSQIMASPGSYYLGGTGKLARSFSYLKKYPRLFEGDNSDAIVTVQQDHEGSIWAGSYKNHLAIIKPSGTTRTPLYKHRYTNGGTVIGDDVYLIDENPNTGLMRIQPDLQVQSLSKGVSGFYTLADHEKEKFYFGTGGNGLWITDFTSLKLGKPNWKVVAQKQSILLPNIVSIARDSMNRIWMGQPSRGWAIYYSDGDSGRTFLIDKKQTSFGYFSSYVDEYGNVWMGTKQQGLLFYPGKEKGGIDPVKVRSVPHALLQIRKPITAMLRVNDWLILSATDKILAFNVTEWNKNQKAIVRYLSPVEAALQGETEQNTLLPDKRDRSVWFSTSEMLYHWDFQQWLSQPAERAEPTVTASIKDSTYILSGTEISLDPLSNNININVALQGSINLPLFMSGMLIREGDTIHLPEPTLDKQFNYTNLAIGSYKFQLTIFQGDGTVDTRVYPIRINGFLWQQWWFWLLVSAVAVSVVSLLISQRKRSQLAEQKARAKEAELAAFKTENEKLLANMQIVTLSNQFRPHFILNALNTIGAEMQNNPGAESVLSRLGESINIIFTHAQRHRIAHPFGDEWQLVTNIIAIHKIMYLTELETKLPDQTILDQIKDFNLPLGIIQIPVENALLHGLGNKSDGPWQLEIKAALEDRYLKITIQDNGVGRQRAASMSNYRKHGTGTKNLSGVVEILNKRNTEQIQIHYTDLVPEVNGSSGTIVIIQIPTLFHYDA